jgi:hypothetical protein
LENVDEESVHEVLEPLQLPQKDIIIIPINDNENKFAVGGTHWYDLLS